MTSSIFSPAADTAVFIPSGSADDTSLGDSWRRAAGERDWLIVDLHDVPAPDGPWRGDATPGRPAGCRVLPDMNARRFTIYGDAAGLYLVSCIDLLLRSHGVRRLLFIGSPNALLHQTLETFASLQGYVIDYRATPPDHSPRERCDTDERPSIILPDLATRVSPRHAALVLIDLQNDFCADEGATGRGGQPIMMIKAAVERSRALLSAARDAGVFVVHVRAEYGMPFRSVSSPYRFPTNGGREPAVWTASAADLSQTERFSNASVEVCLPGSWGAEFIDGIEPAPGEAVITKHRFGAFADTGLDRLLRSRGISSLIVSGVTTNCCVETTAREAVMRDFHLVVAEDCVAVKDHLVDLHRASLESLGLYFGLVRPSSIIMAHWAGNKANQDSIRTPT
ncbi:MULTISPECIES: isochorismatase family cysteine hydrolase [unclassified Chelatococcus]|uniref:cysteine hydrolase family protein n=1 Tax=unclassified Chelatococcus TaxID=2638111 RepID=UPI001BCEDF46|nr:MULTISPECIES: isochorismatase family cysteine hydrolase [unclassified Chelatococcus]MBS7700836.1 cysteine hydrolase [Chelatococcus sp. YT9]MBX3555369.1 cysteine hydrolase [Chelatococcus sp.]